MFDDAKYGMKHTIPVSTNFKVLKHFSVSMNGNFDEIWTGNTTKRNDFNSNTQQQGEKINIKGFDRYNQYDFGMSVGTTIYGLFNFKESSKVQSIRHVIRPSLSYNIRPSFKKYYDTYIIDANGNTAEYTRFEENFFGRPSKTYSSSIGIQISNNIEAKVKYGFPAASPNLISHRAAFLLKVIGIRHDADLFLAEYAKRTGASKPGINLL